MAKSIRMSYEQRHGHPRTRLARKHIAIQQRKRENAEERQRYWNSLSTAERYADLVDRGHGHCRQAKRLLDLISIGA